MLESTDLKLVTKGGRAPHLCTVSQKKAPSAWLFFSQNKFSCIRSVTCHSRHSPAGKSAFSVMLRDVEGTRTCNPIISRRSPAFVLQPVRINHCRHEKHNVTDWVTCVGDKLWYQQLEWRWFIFHYLSGPFGRHFLQYQKFRHFSNTVIICL